MKAVLIVTAAIEAGTGLTLLVSPSTLAWLLFGTSLDTPTALAVGRVAGAGLLSLGFACWLTRADQPKSAAASLIAPMTLYNTAAVAILAVTGFRSDLFGVGFWPALVLHLAMAAWCIVCLRMQRTGKGDAATRLRARAGWQGK